MTKTATKPAAKAAIDQEQARRVVGKAPAPRGRKKTHTKPAVPRAAKEAERVTETMYQALMAPGAPRATPQGYIMGASMVLKMLIDQAVGQGEDRDALKMQAITIVSAM